MDWEEMKEREEEWVDKGTHRVARHRYISKGPKEHPFRLLFVLDLDFLRFLPFNRTSCDIRGKSKPLPCSCRRIWFPTGTNRPTSFSRLLDQRSFLIYRHFINVPITASWTCYGNNVNNIHVRPIAKKRPQGQTQIADGFYHVQSNYFGVHWRSCLVNSCQNSITLPRFDY